DVTFESSLGVALAPSSYTIDPASITDLQPEFTLSGPGLNSLKLDSGQAPTRLGTTNTYRYWASGTLGTGSITLTFLPGSWSCTQNAQATSSTTVTLNDPQFINVTFPTVPDTFSIDPASI